MYVCMYCTYNSNNNNNSNDFYAQCVSFKRITYMCTAIDHDEDTGSNNNNNELYLHDHTNTYSIAKAMFRNQNYNTGQLRYFDNNLSRTSKLKLNGFLSLLSTSTTTKTK